MSRYSHQLDDPLVRPENSISGPLVPGHVAEDDEIDLGQYARLLWGRRWIIAVAAIFACALFSTLSLMAPRQYRATETIAVSQSKLGTEEMRGATAANFLPLVRSNLVARQVIAEFRLDKPPYLLSTTDLVEKVLTVEELRTTTLIQLQVTLPDATLAARVANRVAERAVELSRQLNQNEAVQARDYIKQQLDEARMRRDEAGRQLESYRKQAQLELLRKDVEALLDERGGLLRLEADTVAERARLAKSEQELAKRNPKGTVLRSIDSNPAMLEAAREQGAGTADVFALQMREEYVDRVSERLAEDVATGRASLAALEQVRTQLLGRMKVGAPRIPELDELYTRELKLARLQFDYELATKVYNEVATKYEGARLQVAARSAQLQIVDPALTPDRPVSRKLARNAVAGLFLGAALAALALVVMHAGRSLTTQTPPHAP